MLPVERLFFVIKFSQVVALKSQIIEQSRVQYSITHQRKEQLDENDSSLHCLYRDEGAPFIISLLFSLMMGTCCTCFFKTLLPAVQSIKQRSLE